MGNAQGRGRGMGNGQGRGRGMRNGMGPGQGMRNGMGPGQGMRNGRGLGPGAAAQPGTLAGTKILPEAYLKRIHTAWLSEIQAQNHYLAASKQVGGRIYQNLARAEGNHARALASILRSQGLRQDPVPAVEKEGQAVPVVLDSSKAQLRGIEIEKEVIKFYADLIKDCPDPGIRPILENIQAANHRHLRALGGSQ